MELTPEILVRAYCSGAFPMARSRDAAVEWFTVDPRAILPMDAFHVSRSLRRRIRQRPYELSVDTAFEAVVRACGEPRPYEGETWINDQIVRGYTRLHELGLAHCIEAWGAPGRADLGPPSRVPGAVRADGAVLLGGIYGVALGGAFFGESMFSRATDASKLCLAALVERLRGRGYTLFDVQMHNHHLEQFGIVQVRKAEYLRMLRAALALPVSWEGAL
jgi:leucyl/phenylalanyl-tRNA--protein transferase